ncbi:MAG: beta-lactamase family protein [Clostridia bacterium]|nr:beta-lactamase family protein [Clostridia bacterium]
MRFSKSLAVLFLISTLLLSSCGQTQQTPLTPTLTASPHAKVYDGNQWSLSTPAEQKVEEKLLKEMEKRIDENYPNINATLLIRHGRIVYEKYYNGNTADTFNPVYSVTKSVTSALVGIALREGFLKSLDQTVLEFLPEYAEEGLDPLKKEITLWNALTMTGGLKTVDTDYYSWFSKEDWFKYVLDRPMSSKPGEEFEYNTGLTHLLSGVLTKATSMSTKDFADKYLFKALDINDYNWDTDPKGFYGGGHLLSLTPRDMAKFGFLYLHGGKWGEKQVVPADWVRESVTKKVSAGSSDYGYLWWISTCDDAANKRTLETFFASGYGGQYIMVVPDLDLIFVITADADRRAKDGSDTAALLKDYIVPASK